jgi:phosphoglycerate dehydrogenase-like enzyme
MLMAHEVLLLSRKFRDNMEFANEFLQARDCYVSPKPISYPVDEEQLCDLASSVEGIITGLEHISQKVMAAAPNLKVVSAGGVGYDHIDTDEATRRGITVAICAGCNNHAVSELAIGMMLNLARQVRVADNALRNDTWERMMGGELWGKTLGIVGLGRVGRATALLGKAFGMRVLANDIDWDITFANTQAISYVPLDTLLRESDYISLHCPLTSVTRSLIDEDAIDKMKESAILINTARGPVVKEEALVNALASKRIAGAGLDVFEVEPHPDNPYTEFDNVIMTPHIGGSTQEAFDRAMYLAMVNVTNVLNGHPAHCPVN